MELVVQQDDGRLRVEADGAILVTLDAEQAAALGHHLTDATEWTGPEGTLGPEAAAERVGEIAEALTAIVSALRAQGAPDQVVGTVDQVAQHASAVVEDLLQAAAARSLGPPLDAEVQILAVSLAGQMQSLEAQDDGRGGLVVALDPASPPASILVRRTSGRPTARTGLLDPRWQSAIARLRQALDALDAAPDAGALYDAIRRTAVECIDLAGLLADYVQRAATYLLGQAQPPRRAG